jgi:bifunctional non-homologous end joining protein LigD
VVFLVLDLLRLYGVDLADRPFRERRRSLERLAAAHPAWTVPPAFDDAAATLAAADRHGLRGVVAKRLDSPYRPGVSSPDWVLCPLPAAGD